MAAIINFFTNHYDVILGALVSLASLVYGAVLFFRNRKRIKNAKTDEEKAEVINSIKADVMGFITIAENLFSDIPKSGASKLLYVLNQVKKLCTTSGIEYDQNYWSDFISGIVGRTNGVQESKEEADEILRTIESVKGEVPFLITEANELFARIPDNLQYKIEYILKFIAIACEKYPVNVYSEYDWRDYVEKIYQEKEVA